MTSEEIPGAGRAAHVEHEPLLSRYTLWQDGEPVGLADYRLVGREMQFTHTEVDPARRDHGLASILVEQALDDVRTRTDYTVVAACPYVAEWIESHVEYQDLLSRGR
jgi:predicted GNAT family acetyltransferase